MLLCPSVARRSTTPTKRKKPGRPPRHAADAEARFPGARVIKRYGNRRLYDAKLSRCVTMSEIADFVRKGEDLRVLDGDSGEDITKRILTQIILEEQNARQLELLPVELLRRIIAARSEPAMRWMEQAMGAWTQFLERQNQVAGTSIDALFPWLKAFTPPGQAQAAPPPAAPPDDAAGLHGELEELKRRMADLAARLGKR